MSIERPVPRTAVALGITDPVEKARGRSDKYTEL